MSSNHGIKIKEKNAIFDHIASTTAGAKRTKNGVLLPLDAHGSFYHITDISPINKDAYREFGDEWIAYSGICSVEDYKKIITLNSPYDHLLKIRADSILDNMRVYRVFQNRFKKAQGMTLSKWYARNDRVNTYLSYLSKGNQVKLGSVPIGTAMLQKPNAVCMRVDKSNIIIISEKLMYALYFFNIFIYGESLGFNQEECNLGLIIALRIVYGYETLDFDLDNRGEFPDYIERNLQKITSYQYDFIVGHEYAHHILGHLDNSKLYSERFLNNESSEKNQHYIHRFKEEYDADWYAVKNLTGDSSYKNNITNAAFSCFFFFYVLENFGEYIAPSGNVKVKNHPPAMSRLNSLRAKVKSKYGESKSQLELTKNAIDGFLNYFINDMMVYHMDDFEVYGSLYFERFKNKKLIDRFDY